MRRLRIDLRNAILEIVKPGVCIPQAGRTAYKLGAKIRHLAGQSLLDSVEAIDDLLVTSHLLSTHVAQQPQQGIVWLFGHISLRFLLAAYSVERVSCEGEQPCERMRIRIRSAAICYRRMRMRRTDEKTCRLPIVLSDMAATPYS